MPLWAASPVVCESLLLTPAGRCQLGILPMGPSVPLRTMGAMSSGLPKAPVKVPGPRPPQGSLPLVREAKQASGGEAGLRLEPKMPDTSPPCRREPVCPEAIVCHTTPQASPGEAVVRVVFGRAQRTLLASPFHYTADPQLVAAEPSVSFRG